MKTWLVQWHATFFHLAFAEPLCLTLPFRFRLLLLIPLQGQVDWCLGGTYQFLFPSGVLLLPPSFRASSSANRKRSFPPSPSRLVAKAPAEEKTFKCTIRPCPQAFHKSGEGAAESVAQTVMQCPAGTVKGAID